MGRDDYQAAMQTFCRIHAIPPPEAEYRFDNKRKWRFDFMSMTANSIFTAAD